MLSESAVAVLTALLLSSVEAEQPFPASAGPEERPSEAGVAPPEAPTIAPIAIDDLRYERLSETPR